MRRKRRLGRALLALVCLGAVMFVALVGTVSVCAALERAVEPADCIIVLGARVRPDGTLSDSLRYRCEAALEAWREGLAPAIIVCGAQGGDEPMPEAVAMRGWLAAQGVPEANIVLEDASFNTEQNLENAKALMDERGWKSAVVVTSDYHLQRALWLARDAGIEASGIAAESPHTLGMWLKDRLREACSWGVYALNKVFRR